MNNVIIVTDSCADIRKDMRERFGIEYVQMNNVFKGKEVPASLDWEYFPPKEIYDILRTGERVLTTQVPVETFEKKFTEWLDKGNDIVYLACCVHQSGSVNTAKNVAKKLLEKYPNREIYCVDSLNASAGEALVAIRAAMYRNEGLSAKEIFEKIEVDKSYVREFITLDTLSFLTQSGRIQADQTFLGDRLGVKIIITNDIEGRQVPCGKVKGRDASIQEIVKLLKANIVDPENQIIMISHADCTEDANYLKELIEKEIPCKEIYVSYINSIVGSCVGPNTIGVWAFGTKNTFTLNK